MIIKEFTTGVPFEISDLYGVNEKLPSWILILCLLTNTVSGCQDKDNCMGLMQLGASGLKGFLSSPESD